ncbi:hypothetical protein Gotur_012598, partial [Gossypium turneri]
MVNQSFGSNVLNYPMVNQPMRNTFSLTPNTPYQIWFLYTMLDSPRLSALNEDKEHLAKTIDKCQKDPSYYQIQIGIDLMAKARYLLQEKNYYIRTDGRRIMAYYSTISNKDEESIQLLKKIAEMDIEDFPPHIL